ncbi:TRAP transporter large permease subunit [Brevibacterium sp. UCMA 11754]|uniref:TRAP transporter large permease subunit n=1 Tax=Brevibacterium sp. UCMA 11754 TaxID=2749198 RepID=UPI003FA49A82
MGTLGRPRGIHEQNRGAGLVVALAVGSLVVLLAAPLTSTATIAAVGGVAFTALTAAGAGPVPAAVAVLLFSATEGCSPPGAAPIYIVSVIGGRVDPGKLFVRLILWFVIPTIILGSLVALGLLPIFSIA